MTINAISLKNSMNKFVQTIMPLDEEKETFKKNLLIFLNKLNNNVSESEEFQKGLLKEFLSTVLPNNFINTSKRIDLAIYNGMDTNSSLGVIFECKSLLNKSEMMTKDKINSKAFQEAVAYYLKERIIYKNIEIKKIIITNGLSWFVIESKEFEKYFFNNNKLVNHFEKFNKKQLSSSNSNFLYTEVISPHIDVAIEKGITIAHFDLRDATNDKSKKIEIKQKNLTQLFRFFTPENLLNKEIFTDSNKLNKGFYDELLYLMGLEEIKNVNSKLISRLKPAERQRYSFVENIINKLEMRDIPKEIQEETAIQLTVVWMNRILFLKLLESQLVLFNEDESYKFLTYDKLPSFEEIYTLFFAVLAKRETDRNVIIQEKFDYIPYLNSSLFEETELEMSRKGIGIDQLAEGEINIFSKSSLKGTDRKRKTGRINFIKYLFEFLDSYDFSTSINHHVKSKSDLINASVLGLIFEKINGYRDGSFYTPGSITMYMSRQSIRDATISKVNEKLNLEIQTIEELKYYIGGDLEKAKNISDIIDTLKVCDPAVGSGHFLVSILNEIIALKSDLNVLFDSDGKTIGHLIQCYVINDELVIQDKSGNNFIYQTDNKQAEHIQKAIFNQKRHILENTLFAVDINPSSVNICRLRLWIELLKSSYYYIDQETGIKSLTTLPNIDINIKVGDSLLHKFDFNLEFDMRRNDFKEYLNLVSSYKETNNKIVKADIMKQINKLKNSFDDTALSPELQKLRELIQTRDKVGAINLFEVNPLQEKQVANLNKEISRAKKALEVRKSNPIYSKGLEWRMEFPEILQENGKFLGFDLVIANPPYIFAQNESFSDEMKAYYLRNYPLNNYQANTFGLFLELAFSLIRKNGVISYIIPNTFLTINQYKPLRQHILKSFKGISFINSQDKIFEEASVDVCIVSMSNVTSDIFLGEIKSGEINLISRTNAESLINQEVITMKGQDNDKSILVKIENNSKPLESNYARARTGLEAYERGKGSPKQPSEKEEFLIFKETNDFFSDTQINEEYRKFISKGDLQRYSLNWSGMFLKYGKHLAAPRDPSIFEGNRILLARVPQKGKYAFRASITNESFIHEQNINAIVDIKCDEYYLLGVLNSKIMTYYTINKFDFMQRKTFPQIRLNWIKEFPIPYATEKQQSEISLIVKNILKENIQNDSKSDIIKKLEHSLDDYIMDLYNLTEDEKQIVKEFVI